jgi:hypothetical protein
LRPGEGAQVLSATWCGSKVYIDRSVAETILIACRHVKFVISRFVIDLPGRKGEMYNAREVREPGADLKNVLSQ